MEDGESEITQQTFGAGFLPPVVGPKDELAVADRAAITVDGLETVEELLAVVDPRIRHENQVAAAQRNRLVGATI